MARHGDTIGLRSIALVEAAKGLLVLIAGLGLAAFWHRDAQHVVETVVTRLHFNPSGHLPTIFMDLASHPDDPRLWAFGASAAVYVVMRLSEAYGLWHARAWAFWLGVWSGAIYIPVELYESIRHPNLLHIGVAVVNFLVVLFLVWNLLRTRGKGAPA